MNKLINENKSLVIACTELTQYMRHMPKKRQSAKIIICKLSQLFRKSSQESLLMSRLGHTDAAHPGCRTTGSDVKLSVASFMGFTVQS